MNFSVGQIVKDTQLWGKSGPDGSSDWGARGEIDDLRVGNQLFRRYLHNEWTLPDETFPVSR